MQCHTLPTRKAAVSLFFSRTPLTKMLSKWSFNYTHAFNSRISISIFTLALKNQAYLLTLLRLRLLIIYICAFSLSLKIIYNLTCKLHPLLLCSTYLKTDAVIFLVHLLVSIEKNP